MHGLGRVGNLGIVHSVLDGFACTASQGLLIRRLLSERLLRSFFTPYLEPPCRLTVCPWDYLEARRSGRRTGFGR